jgi:hypothetical protein
MKDVKIAVELERDRNEKNWKIGVTVGGEAADKLRIDGFIQRLLYFVHEEVVQNDYRFQPGDKYVITIAGEGLGRPAVVRSPGRRLL